jgi:hypothetical protein
MRYVRLDGFVSGTGLRDCNSGGWLNPYTVGLSDQLAAEIEAWAYDYHELQAHHDDDVCDSRFKVLDEKGIALSYRIRLEHAELKVDYYFSDYTGAQIFLT